MAELTSKPSPDVFGTKAGSNSCKLPSKEDTGTSPLCPQCKSQKVWRDGIRYISAEMFRGGYAETADCVFQLVPTKPK